MLTADPEPAALPADADERLREARRKTTDALLEAETLERQAHKARRRATSLQKNYERLVAEHYGQASLLDEDGVM